MLPRGNKAGMKFRLFGMVSKLLEKDQTYKYDKLFIYYDLCSIIHAYSCSSKY